MSKSRFAKCLSNVGDCVMTYCKTVVSNRPTVVRNTCRCPRTSVKEIEVYCYPVRQRLSREAGLLAAVDAGAAELVQCV